MAGGASVLREALKYSSEASKVLAGNVAAKADTRVSTKRVDASPIILAGEIGGLVSSISRNVDLSKLNIIRAEGATVDYYSSIIEIVKPVQNLIGSVDDGTLPKLVDPINDFFSQVNSALQNPSNKTLKAGVVDAGVRLCTTLSTAAQSCVDAKVAAQTRLMEELDRLNSNIRQLVVVNNLIERTYATGSNTSGLEDQRDALITEISHAMLVDAPRFKSNGTALIKAGATQLVNGDVFASFSYTPVDPEAIANGASVGIITLNLNRLDGLSDVDTVDSTQLMSQVFCDPSLDKTRSTSPAKLPNGTIKAFVDVQESVLDSYLGCLDSLAFNVREAVNKIHNSGASFSGRSSILGSGTTGYLDKRAWTGSATIAVVDETGQPIKTLTNTVSTMKLDLEAMCKVANDGMVSTQDIIAEINGVFGNNPAQYATGMGLQQGSSGKYLVNDMQMVISSPTPNGFKFDLEILNTSDFDAQIDILGVNLPLGASYIGTLPTTSTISRGQKARTFQPINISNAGVAAGLQNIDVVVRVRGSNGVVQEGTIRYQVDFGNIPYTNTRVGGTAPALGGGQIQNFAQVPLARESFINTTLLDTNGNIIVNPAITGNLSLQASDPKYRIVIQDDSSSTSLFLDGFKTNSRGFGHFFGLNNLFDSSDKYGRYALDMAVRPDIEADPNLLSDGRLIAQKAQTVSLTTGTVAASATVQFSGVAANYGAGASITINGKLFNFGALAGQINIPVGSTLADAATIVANFLSNQPYFNNLLTFTVNGDNLVITAANTGTSGNNITFDFQGPGGGATPFNGAANAAGNLAGGTDNAGTTLSLSPLGMELASGYADLYADLYKLEQLGTRFVPSSVVGLSRGRFSDLAMTIGSIVTGYYSNNESNLKISKKTLEISINQYKADFGFDADDQTIQLADISDFKRYLASALAQIRDTNRDIINLLTR